MGKQTFFRMTAVRLILVAMFLFSISQLYGDDRRASGASRTRIGAEAAVNAFQGLKTLTVPPAVIKAIACTTDEECRLEECSQFYGLLQFILMFYPTQTWDHTYYKEVTLEAVDMTCGAYPKELWDSGGSLNALIWACAKDKNNKITALSKESCPNPMQPSGTFANFLALLDPAVCSQGFPPESCKYYNPATHIPICLQKGVSIGGLAKACGENCCQK